jgi:ribosomal protein S18 acetylase RimI-like enzyme
VQDLVEVVPGDDAGDPAEGGDRLPGRFAEAAHRSPLYDRTVALRDELLRRPLGLAFSPEELDAEAGSHHLVMTDAGGEAVVACLVLRPLGGGAVQMRQVAVAPEHQRRGVGRALVAFAERYAAERGYREMVVHAREPVVPFYDRLGYQRVGARFIEVTLPHLELRKALGPR